MSGEARMIQKHKIRNLKTAMGDDAHFNQLYALPIQKLKEKYKACTENEKEQYHKEYAALWRQYLSKTGRGLVCDESGEGKSADYEMWYYDKDKAWGLIPAGVLQSGFFGIYDYSTPKERDEKGNITEYIMKYITREKLNDALTIADLRNPKFLDALNDVVEQAKHSSKNIEGGYADDLLRVYRFRDRMLGVLVGMYGENAPGFQGDKFLTNIRADLRDIQSIYGAGFSVDFRYGKDKEGNNKGAMALKLTGEFEDSQKLYALVTKQAANATVSGLEQNGMERKADTNTLLAQGYER